MSPEVRASLPSVHKVRGGCEGPAKCPAEDPVTNTWAMARSYVTTARNAAIADVLVRRLSLGVLVCDRVWLNRPVGGFVVGVGVGDRLGLVHLARLVVLRRVDGVDLHRLVADVGDVVPAAGRNDDA